MNQSTNLDWAKFSGIFLRYRSGDAEAASEVFGALQKVLRGYFRVRMTNSTDAEDMVQTTLLKIHFGRHYFDETLSFKTWIFTIAHRALIDHWRVGAKDKENLSPHEPELENTASDGLLLDEVFEIKADMEGALNKLKPNERSIVYLYGVEGLSMAEIAAIHGTTEGAMKVRVHRAVQQLKGLLVSILIFILVKVIE